MPLAETEKSFIKSLLQPASHDEDFLSKLSPLNSLTEERQLYIYRSNVNGAHQKVLGQVYPACLNILGEDYFNQLCRAYRFEHPSTDADLNHYGQVFPGFIYEQVKQHKELDDFEYLPELANLEWHWHKSFYSKDNALFDFNNLMSVDAAHHDRLVFLLSDSFSLFSTPYPLLEIWQANKSNEKLQQEFMLPESNSYFCISRPEFVSEVEVLTFYQYQLLKSIVAGASLSQLYEIESENSEPMQQQLTYFIERKWITGFSLQD